MKKLLSVVLVLAMILGSFSMVFATDFSDVKDTDVNSEAINVLSGLGVIGGYADGTFRPEGTVTRAEMATMIVNALGIPVKGGAATKFSDVPASHWASGYINYAESVGFIAGYTDGTFKPEKQVSYNEAITMIVAALGYNASILPGTYPGSFINKATSLGILDVCKTTGTIGACRADIAQMLYGAMDCAIGYVDKDGVFRPNEGKTATSDDTMFERLGCTFQEVAIVITGDEDSDINLKPYIGAYVTYYTDGEDADDDIVAIAEVKSEFITGEIDDLKDDYNFDSAAVFGEYVHFENGKEAAIVAYDSVADETIILAVEKSGKKIKTVYSMQEWTISAADVIDNTEDVQDEIADDHKLLDEVFAEDDNEEIDMDSFVLVGAASLKDIKEDDVVYVYSNADGIAKIEVGTETITGTVSKIDSKNEKFTIASKVYEFADTENSSVDKGEALPTTGDEIEAKLDYAGKIYSFEAVSSDAEYAVLLDKGNDTSRYGADTVYVKMFLADGTEKEVEVKDTCATAVASIAAVSGDLVSYKINSKGLLTEIETVTNNLTVGKINAKGVVGTDVVKDSTIIFSYNGDGVKKADNYSVVKAANVMDTTPATMTGEAADGVVKAMLVTGINTADDELVVVTGWASIDDDNYNYEITALYEGAVKTFKSEVNKDESDATISTTTASAVMYKLTFDANECISSVSDPITTTTKTGAGVKTTVDGSIVTVDGDTKYALEDDVVVYVYDESDDKWTVGTAKSCAVKAADLLEMAFFDTDSTPDGIYEFVLVFKK